MKLHPEKRSQGNQLENPQSRLDRTKRAQVLLMCLYHRHCQRTRQSLSVKGFPMESPMSMSVTMTPMDMLEMPMAMTITLSRGLGWRGHDC